MKYVSIEMLTHTVTLLLGMKKRLKDIQVIIIFTCQVTISVLSITEEFYTYIYIYIMMY